jgi:hypothetical protein
LAYRVAVRLADNQDIQIEKTFIHENYQTIIPKSSDDANKNNIALIQLQKDADLSKLVSLIGYESMSDVSLVIDWRLLDEGNAKIFFCSLF